MLRRLLVLFVLGTASLASAEPARAVRSASFDWDANVANMTTKVYLKKRSGGEIAMTTAEWDTKKKLLGKPGPFEDAYIDRGHGGTYRDMGDQPGKNPFLTELEKTVTHKGWQGPAWDAFVEQLSTPDGAKRASIITAREHSPDSIYAGLKFLKQRGLIRYLPPRSNLFAVNRADATLDGFALKGETPARKLMVQKTVLDRLQQAAERNRGQRQVWHFSDDDWANYEATVHGLQAEIDAKRWPNVDVVVHFTGQHDADHVPEVVTLARPRI